MKKTDCFIKCEKKECYQWFEMDDKKPDPYLCEDCRHHKEMVEDVWGYNVKRLIEPA